MRSYFIQRDGSEIGPFTIPQLNQMRARNEIAGSDLCRAAETTESRPLADVFPHMGNFVVKPRAQHKREAEITEGDSMANAALVCGILAWFIAGPVLGAFAVVLGIKSSLRVKRWKATAGVILGAIAFASSVAHIFEPHLRFR